MQVVSIINTLHIKCVSLNVMFEDLNSSQQTSNGRMVVKFYWITPDLQIVQMSEVIATKVHAEHRIMYMLITQNYTKWNRLFKYL